MATAAQHNGGRSQTGLNFLQTGGEYPFINFMKTSQDFTYVSNPNKDFPVDPALRDSDGYPTSIQAGGYNTVIYVPSQAALPGDYWMEWDGNGQAAVPGTITSGSDISSTGSGICTFTPNSQRLTPGVVSTAASPNHIRNIRVYHSSERSRFLAGEIFGAKFLSRLIQANFGVIRFLDWQSANNSNVTTWSLKTPDTYHTYQTDSRWVPSLWFGDTTSSGNTYSISTGRGRAPQHGDFVQCRFNTDSFASVSAAVSSSTNTVLTIGTGGTNATFTSVGETVEVAGVTGAWAGLNGTWTVQARSAGSVTVNFNSSALTPGGMTGTVSVYHKFISLNTDTSGAVNVLSCYATPITLDNNTHVYGGLLATLYYDGDLAAWIKYGGDLGFRSRGMDSGVPIEICLRLCQELGAHPYFVTPPRTIDPATDYMPSLATYVRSNSPSWMIPRYEGPNELWNMIFFATNYANAKAKVYWGLDDNHYAWYGKVMSVLGQILSAVYGVTKNPNVYQVLCGVQTGTYTFPSNNDERFKSTTYVGQAAAAQSGYTKTPAYNFITHLACAQYWNPAGQFDAVQEQADAEAYAAASEPTKTNIALAYADGCNYGPDGGVSVFATISASFKPYLLALPSPVTRMCGYEGNYSPDYRGRSDAVYTLRWASKMAPNMGAYLTAVYSNFKSANDSTFTAEFPSCFILGDYPIPGGAEFAGGMSYYVWAVMQGDVYATPTPQFDAICRYNAVKRAMPAKLLRLHG